MTYSEEYVRAVAVEAQLREEGKTLSVKDFVSIRRDNSAVRLGLCLIEVRVSMGSLDMNVHPNQYCLGIDLPEFVLEDPTFQEIYWAGVDLVCWQNVRLQTLYHD